MSTSSLVELDVPPLTVLPQQMLEDEVLSGTVKLNVTDSSGLTVRGAKVYLLGNALVEGRTRRIVVIQEFTLVASGSSTKYAAQPTPHVLPFVLCIPPDAPPSFSNAGTSVNYVVTVRMTTGRLARREIVVETPVELVRGPDFAHEDIVGAERTGFHAAVGSAVLLVPHSTWAASDTLAARLLLRPASKEPLQVTFALEQRVGKRGEESTAIIAQGQPLDVRAQVPTRSDDPASPQLARMLVVAIPRDAVDVQAPSVGMEVRHRLMVRVAAGGEGVTLGVTVRIVSSHLLNEARRATMPTRVAICGIVELQAEVQMEDEEGLQERKRMAQELPHYFEHPQDLLLMLPSGAVNGSPEKRAIMMTTGHSSSCSASSSTLPTPSEDLSTVPDYDMARVRDGLIPLWSLKDLPDYRRSS